MTENDSKALPEQKAQNKEGDGRSEKAKEKEAIGSKLVTPIFSQPVAVIIRSRGL